MTPEIQAILQNYVNASQSQAAMEREHCQKVAELNARAIFLATSAKVPVELKKAVQEVLMPSGEVIVIEESE